MLREGIDLKSVEHLLKNRPDIITPVLEDLDRAMKGEAPKAVKIAVKNSPKPPPAPKATTQKAPAPASKPAASKPASKTPLKTVQKKFGF